MCLRLKNVQKNKMFVLSSFLRIPDPYLHFESPRHLSPPLPGSSPSGSRVIRRGDGIGILGKNLFNYRYKERLERNSVVGRLVEKRGWITWFTWDTNKALRQEVCTTYVGHRHLSVLPKERRHWGLPSLILEAQAKLAGLVSTHAPDGNSARKTENKKETIWGNQSFQKLICFLYFQVCLYTFCYT